jgi:hypothetical protein
MKRQAVFCFVTLLGFGCCAVLIGGLLLAPSAALMAQESVSPTPTMTMTPTAGFDPFSPTLSAPTLLPTPGVPAGLPAETPQVPVTPSPTPSIFTTPTNAPVSTLPAGGFSSGANFLARVDTDSLNVRRLPSEESDHIASLFDGDVVQVVSRNLDGSWFEVRRIGRMSNLGWVLNELLEWDLLPEALPLGDTTVGVSGPVPLSAMPLYGVYLEAAPILRELPLRDGRRIMALPPLIVVPVVARNQDASWLQVNYFGFQGWINRASIRERAGVEWNTLPVPPGLPPPDSVPVIIIPIEIQQGQIDRLRTFIDDRREMSAALEAFWWSVYRGEIMPCNPPAEVSSYLYSEADIRELPELGRYIPRLGTAIDYLRTAREPLLNCGIIAPSVTVDARNSAINARVIFDATLQALDNLEETIYQSR